VAVAAVDAVPGNCWNLEDGIVALETQVTSNPSFLKNIPEESMQSSGNTIFVGVKVNDRLREQLDSCHSSMKSFFAGNNPEYLRILQVDSDEYIGKVTESGASLEALSNMLMNVKTMLRMICPKFVLPDAAIKIHALTQPPAR
jgi:hypothetical protein